jgi:ABC-type sugar transport system permease subunit
MQSISTETGKRPRSPLTYRVRHFLNKEGVAGWLFILPVVVGVAIFTYAALVYSFYLSLTEWDLLRPPRWTGLSNYRTLLTRDEEFVSALKNTLFFVITLVPAGIVCAMSLAILMNRKIKGIGFFRAAYYMPHITSTIAIGMVWLWIFNPDLGLINTILRAVGVTDPPQWLSSVIWAKPALLIMRIWQVTGYYMILYIAGLQTIPDELYEAASIDGATRWHKVRYITIPLLANTTFFVTIMLTIESFNIFEAVFAMTEGGPGGSTNTLLYYIYTEAFKSYRMGYAASISWVLFVIIFGLTVIQFAIRRRRERERL